LVDRQDALIAYWKALSQARTKARMVNSRTIEVLYGAGPRKSELGRACSAAIRPACLIVTSSRLFPLRKSLALSASRGVGPTLVSPMPASLQTPDSSSVTCAATPTVAKSPTFRSSLKYAPPLRAGGVGMRI